MGYDLIGKDFTPPDVPGKVTGRAKYAEDFRVEGMVFCKLLTSPIPHGRFHNTDTRKALAMEGVLGVVTADDVLSFPAPEEEILTNEPKYVGAPILAVVAIDETTAENAIEQITYDIEPLPFTVDPLESLYPGGPDARLEGNAVQNEWGKPAGVHKVKWSARDFVAGEEGQLPLGKPLDEWSYGDVEAGFNQADFVLDETFVTASNCTSFHGAAYVNGLLAEWQMFSSCLDPEPEFHRSQVDKVIGHRGTGSGRYRGKLWWWLRLQGGCLSNDGHSGLCIQNGWSAGHAAGDPI